MLGGMEPHALPHPVPPERRIYCNRTLNLRSIRAIGYDMDYTLVHYRVKEWEERAFDQIRRRLLLRGWPVEDLQFDERMVIRGLVVDTELGNMVKANRFGFVVRACHGTRFLDHREQREIYSRTIVDLSQPRWYFLNTLFSLSEGSMFLQLVDLLDQGKLPGAMGYQDLFRAVRQSLDEAHMEGELKDEIVSNPDRFAVKDPEVPLALLDQHHAGKKLLLITNSDWGYAAPIMSWAFDSHLPGRMTWRDLFDVVIVSARKPEFFTSQARLFEVVTEEGLLRPATGGLKKGTAYFGGSARMVERHLGLTGDEILYVGDHMYGDVHVSKDVLRWRTALILRELEDEVRAIEEFRARRAELERLMEEKTLLEDRMDRIRLEILRKRNGYGPVSETPIEELEERAQELSQALLELDAQIAPLAQASAQLGNENWGPLMRAGSDKSLLARQMESSADVYTSRVANFLAATPFVYARAARGSLPHDP